MKALTLHIVAFNVPYPADYGGVIDVFYKLKALHHLGVKIHLHCYQYGRVEAVELEQYCEKVYYYPRKKSISDLFTQKPFIVQSRRNNILINNILSVEAPILFEGLHTCYFIDDKRISHLVKYVRTHNVEHHYYRFLANAEKSTWKKWYFTTEANKLERFEKVLAMANAIFAISPSDTTYFKKQFEQTHYIPAFHPNTEVKTPKDIGTYALYHGDLSVQDNEQAVLYLVHEVFSKIDTPLIIAGKNPSTKLKQVLSHYPQNKLVANASATQMDKLIYEAQVHVLPTFHTAGLKLKLLNVLYNGRHVIVNNNMVQDTGLEQLCTIANDAQAMRLAIQQVMDKPMEQEASEERVAVLRGFDTSHSAQSIVDIIDSK